MKGVFLTKAKVVSEDDRRKIIEIQNGQMSVRNMKILIVKKGEALLGNHYHPHYSELMYMFKGSARYRMRNIDTGEVEDYNLVEGDLIFRTSRISHAGFFSEDSIVIDGAEEPYISQNFNDVKDEILTIKNNECRCFDWNQHMCTHAILAHIENVCEKCGGKTLTCPPGT